jgi:signal transduction histidine kinase
MWKMLKRLRYELTGIYLLAAVGLVTLIGAGSYTLLRLYFQGTTDLAMQYKMAIQFRSYNIPLPPELANAEHTWLANNAHLSQLAPTKPPVAVEGGETSEDDGNQEDTSHESKEAAEDAFDGSLSAIFVIPYTTNGVRINYPNPVVAPVIDNQAAITSAMQNGFDWRTVQLGEERRVRLLTYYTTETLAPPVIQIGRLLTDQDRVMKQFLTGLFVLGATTSIVLGLISWWMSGRSLGPAQKAWDQQQIFISNASHELRTPLTLIRATAEYGLRNQPAGEGGRLFGDIVKETDYMNSLVEDLLLLSRLDTERLKLDKKLIQLPELLEEIRRQMVKLTQEKGVELLLEDPRGQVRGDPIRLRQVMLILLDNALRFTPTGGSIRISTHPQGKFVQIRVMDNGKGISLEHLPHVFDRFYQAPVSVNDGNRGNGLGLSIAKALIEAQGGKIHMQSQVGKGTQVDLLLPSTE